MTKKGAPVDPYPVDDDGKAAEDHVALEDPGPEPTPEDLRGPPPKDLDRAPPPRAPEGLPRHPPEGLPRHPPEDRDAELVVIGSALTWPDQVLPILATFLSPDHFYYEAHQKAYRAVLEAFEAGAPLDSVALVRAVENGSPTRGHAQELVNRALEAAPSGVNARLHGRRVLDLAQRRAAIQHGDNLIRAAFRADEPLVETVLETREAIERLSWAAGEAGGSFDVWTGSQIMTAEIPTPPSLVGDKVLQQGGLSFFVSAEGVGKSYLLLELALAAARGSPGRWLDLDVGPPVRTMLLWGEGGASGAKDRLGQLCAGSPIPDDVLIAVPRVYSPDLSTPTAAMEVRALIERYRPGLVVIDTMSEFTGGLDDTDNASCKIFIRHLNAIRRATGVHIAVAHHTRKTTAFSAKGSAREARGGTVLVAAADAVLVLDKEEGEKIRVTWGKLKNAAPRKPLICRIGADFRFEVLHTLKESTYLTHQEQILMALDEAPGDGWMLYEGLEKATHLKRRTLEKHLAPLIEQKQIEKTGGVKGASAAFRRRRD